MKLRMPRNRVPAPWAPYLWCGLAAMQVLNIWADVRPSAVAWWAAWSNWPSHGPRTGPYLWADLALTAVFAALAVRAFQRRRTPSRALLLALAALAAQRREGTWLNRDEHVAFAVTRHLWFWMVNRLPEDSVDEAVRSGEESPVLYETFICTPSAGQVIRMDDTALIAPGGEAVRPLPGNRSLRSLWRRTTISDGPVGTVYAPDEQVTELIAQLRAAERIDHQEPGL